MTVVDIIAIVSDIIEVKVVDLFQNNREPRERFTCAFSTRRNSMPSDNLAQKFPKKDLLPPPTKLEDMFSAWFVCLFAC